MRMVEHHDSSVKQGGTSGTRTTTHGGIGPRDMMVDEEGGGGGEGVVVDHLIYLYRCT